ncbi:MAG TPA: DUF2723 domain-containing protein [Bacteroidota bacterium]|nr:DUF2723 domain-containing protein [Bacteroidota bacterium]
MKRLEHWAEHENVVFAFVALIAFVVYRRTVCPTVSFTDSGELATVATTLGIAHPTGYPLWTLIGRIATILPFGASEIVRLNALSGVMTALSVGLFFKLVLLLLRARRVFRLSNEAIKQLQGPMVVPGTAAAALVFGFSSTIWAQSVEIEVYALHLFLVLAATIFFVHGIEEQLDEPEILSKNLFFFSFVLGLAFANHMTTVLLAPAFLYLFFVSVGFKRRAWQIIVALVPFFVVGISLYLYLPVRSASGPLMDWGHPVTLERLWWHITGKQYQTWMFAGWPVVQKQLGYFFNNFPTEFQWVLVVLLLNGLVSLFKRSVRLLAFLMILFGTCVAYAVNYDINEIDPYFIVAYIACGAVIGFGMYAVLRWMRNFPPSRLRVLAAAFLVILPIVQVVNNRHQVDQSGNYQAEDFVQNAFSGLEPNAVVFSSLWDYFVSPAYYEQIVLKKRADVVIVDRDLLQNRSWYFIQFSRRYPGVLDKSKEKVDAFLSELNKWEMGGSYDYYVIKAKWDALLLDLIRKLMADRAVYVDPRIAGEFPPEFEGIPQGLLIRLVRKGEAAEWRPIRWMPRTGGFDNYVTADLNKYVVSIHTYHALWLSNNGRKPEALDELGKALQIDPLFLPALRLREQLGR